MTLLVDVAPRLGLLIEAVFGTPYRLRTAQTPARPTLLAQRDDACAKGQIRRAEIYDNLLTGLDTHAAS